MTAFTSPTLSERFGAWATSILVLLLVGVGVGWVMYEAMRVIAGGVS